MGDRVRMGGLAGNDRIFMRSLASRDGRGGLSPSTPYVADVIEGFGMDRILIETVGVGQAELDVLSCADIVVLVLQPSTGDAIQTLKAGIIEGADIVVVNKSDLPGVDSAVQALRFVFGLASPNANRPAPPLLQTSAQQSEGIAELLAEIERQATHLNSSGMHLEMRQARLKDEIRAAIRQHLWALLVAQSGIEADIETVSAELASSGGSHYPYVREICSEIALKTPIKLRQRGLNEKPV